MCSETAPSRMCVQHRVRYYSYDHIGPRPVVTRIHFTYKRETFRRPGTEMWIESNVITVHAVLRISGGKARNRPPWRAVFCLTARPDIAGTGRLHAIAGMVREEVKRLGWGFSRGVSCRA